MSAPPETPFFLLPPSAHTCASCVNGMEGYIVGDEFFLALARPGGLGGVETGAMIKCRE